MSKPSKSKPSKSKSSGSKSPAIILSIGMIVKNEQRSLERCLEALAPLRKAIKCELVIADTGSTDSTREIAAKYADILFDFEWCNDFSAARNAVMDRCCGKWFLAVDADEYLDKDISELVGFLTNSKYDDVLAALVVQRNYKTLEMAEGDYEDAYPTRMLRMSTGLRYTGTIHEGWGIKNVGPNSVMVLPGVVLHHDGYVISRSNPSDAKAKRNLVLLEKELEKNPNSLGRAVQCLESSYTDEQRRKYSVMAVKLASEEIEDNKMWRPPAFKDAILAALRCGFSEIEQWIAEARRLFPEDLHVTVDIPFLAAQHYSQTGRFEQALDEIKLFRKGLEHYRVNRLNIKYFTMFPIIGTVTSNINQIYIIEAFCCVKLKKYEEAVEALERLEPEKLKEERNGAYIANCLTELWQEGGEQKAPALLKRYYTALKEGSAQFNEPLLTNMISACIEAFGKGTEEDINPPHTLFASLGEGCDLGRAGLIMAAGDAAEIEKLISGIEEWKNIPSEALLKAEDMGIALPREFYLTGPEAMSRQAAGVARRLGEKVTERMLLLKQAPQPETPGEILWRYLLLGAALEKANWTSEASVELFDLYCASAQRYLSIFVGETLLNDGNITLAGIKNRVAWNLASAGRAFNEGRQAEYIRRLRNALSDMPSLKEMMSELLKREKEQLPAVTDEMRQLAAGIRAMLAQYPPDHPMVKQIKESPAYKQFAHLIEG